MQTEKRSNSWRRSRYEMREQGAAASHATDAAAVGGRERGLGQRGKRLCHATSPACARVVGGGRETTKLGSAITKLTQLGHVLVDEFLSADAALAVQVGGVDLLEVAGHHAEGGKSVGREAGGRGSQVLFTARSQGKQAAGRPCHGAQAGVQIGRRLGIHFWTRGQ
eukprot:scaffold14131_cov107-Isochrysis_galbana.AAC.1